MHQIRTLIKQCGLGLAWALLWHADAAAQVYASEADEGGAIVLSNFQSAQTPELVVAPPPADPRTPPPSMGTGTTRAAMPRATPSHELNGLIDSVAARVQISGDLIRAVIAVESNFDHKALSPRGAMGLMQLLPATAKRFGARDPYAAADNILAGASYLKWLMQLFNDDLSLVLASYNAGEQAVLKAGRKIPPYPETQAYVPRVLAQLQSTAAHSR